MIILGIIVLIIITIVLAIRYFQTARKVLDETDYEKEVVRSAGRILKKDRKITCEYCGTVIDTNKERSCPSCGASYHKNPEWLALKSIDEEKARKEAEKYKEKVETWVKNETGTTKKRLRICLIILGVLLVMLTALVFVIHKFEENSGYAKNEDPAVELSSYEPVGYEIAGDGVIADENGIKITVSDLYRSIYDPYRYRAKVVYENTCGKDARILAYCLGANGYVTGDSCILGHVLLKDGASVTCYETLFLDPFPEECGLKDLYSLTFGRVDAYDRDYMTIFERKDAVTIPTTLGAAPEPAVPEGEVLFSDHGVEILREKSYREDRASALSHVLWITNESGADYEVNAEMNLDGTKLYDDGCNRELIPDGTVFRCELFSYDEAYENAGEADIVELIFSFECADNPAKDFKTGYLPVKMEED